MVGSLMHTVFSHIVNLPDFFFFPTQTTVCVHSHTLCAPETADCWFDEEPTAMLERVGGSAPNTGVL